MKVALDLVVTLNYTLKSIEGIVLDTSAGREPLVYDLLQVVPKVDSREARR